ncbi:TDT family transporter [Aquicella lusitana]|uniref:Voltage-gated anion channel n=1 Tax=Aquicella lusitana TaxID=254246 RepID=A0A370GGR4_9COXI|nr:hypothetical protein [Aquicella lusitana]RDI42436.1 hypothetical protein C8D86_11539 [Aquicella lusitana]VVC74102.1 hypothetical protein AQULUS_18670 [Aquicella lusitana]
MLEWTALIESPLVLLVLLLAFTHLIYYHFFSHLIPPVSSGAIVMAIGIFALHCLPQFHFPALVMRMVAFEVLIIWFYLAVGFLNAYLQGLFFLNRFDHCAGMGTWVAGTAITVLLLDQVEETLHGVIVLLSMIAILMWVIYLAMISKWFWRAIRKRLHMPENGMILLAAVSTQAIVLMLQALFHHHLPMWSYQLLIIAGFLFYLLGLYLILRYLICSHRRHLVAVWPDANCINHGAMAITGLAIISLQVFPDWIIAAAWWWTAISFFIVELLEFSRLMIRIRLKGFMKGLWVYRTPQWSRNFTFGMFYAFTLFYFLYQPDANVLVMLIAGYGQYVVAALLLIEIALAVWSAGKMHSDENN